MASESPEHQPPADVRDLVPLREAAKRCGISYSHLRLLARKGDIWAIRPGHNWLTTVEAVRSYLDKDRRPGPKPR